MITLNASTRARLTAEDREIMPEPGMSFEFEREPNEQTALAMCFSDCCEPDKRIWPLRSKDRDAFEAGWTAHREKRVAAHCWAEGVFMTAIKDGKVKPSERMAFFCGWNGAALWANENLADVLE